MIATDFSPASGELIKTGIDLAVKLNAEIYIIVIVNKFNNYIPPEVGIPFSNQWEARLYLAQERLERIKHEYPDLAIAGITFIGDPKNDILEQSRELDASYIVIGTHGYSGISHMLMGSTAEYIVRHSTIPVVVVPQNKEPH